MLSPAATPRRSQPPSLTKFSEGGLGVLRAVEIFAAGTHRGKQYTDDDLKSMVKNFEQNSAGKRPLLRVPAVLGHEENQEFLERSDLPAAAWAERVYVENRVGKDGKSRPVLLADFNDVPPKIVRLLSNKAYRTVSSEIYDEPPAGINGKGKMLRRVAFLGGDIPQVKTLDDIPEPEIHRDPHRYTPAFVTFREARQSKEQIASRTYWAFSEVSPMDRNALIQQLQASGFDTSLITDATPDPVLAELVRVCGSKTETLGEEPTPPKDEAEKQAYREKAKKFYDQAKKFAASCGMKLDETTSTPPKPDATTKPEESAKMRELEAKLQQLTAFTETRLAAEKKATVKARLDALIQAGKVLPAEIDGGLADLANSMDAVAVHKFSDGSKTVEMTAFDRFFSTLEKRPQLVKFSEIAKGGSNHDAQIDEVEKVEAFVTRPDIAKALEATGQTPASHVEKFNELRKKNPALTAVEFGVPATV